MPASSKLLLEAGYTPFRYNPIFGHPPPDGITNLIPVTEQSNAINPATGQRYAPQANYTYRGMQSWGWAVGKTDGWQATASYVTGAHNMKVGYQGNRLDQLDQTIANQTQLAYRFNQGVPNAVSYWLPDFGRRTITSLHGVFVQDSWTLRPPDGAGRAALRPGVELRAGRTERHDADVVPESGADHHRADARRQRLQRHHAARGRRLRRVRQRQDGDQVQLGPLPRLCRERSAVHVDQPGLHGRPRRAEPRVERDTAAGGNGDLVVDCDLLNPALNGECAAATGTAPNFGRLGAATEVDPGVLSGWGVRPGDHQYTVTLQQELLPRVSADVTYTHRSFHGFFVTDDLNRRAGGVASYYETYTLTAPQDSRLADGGGYPVTVYVPTAAATPWPRGST